MPPQPASFRAETGTCPNHSLPLARAAARQNKPAYRCRACRLCTAATLCEQRLITLRAVTDGNQSAIANNHLSDFQRETKRCRDSQFRSTNFRHQGTRLYAHGSHSVNNIVHSTLLSGSTTNNSFVDVQINRDYFACIDDGTYQRAPLVCWSGRWAAPCSKYQPFFAAHFGNRVYADQVSHKVHGFGKLRIHLFNLPA